MPETRRIERQGIALISSWVADLGHLWNESQVDVGIDGWIELVDTGREESTGRIILVQSKATGFPFSKTGELSYVCREEDLRYWLHGNAPVILIRSHPQSGEAYWVSVKEYFIANPQRRLSRKIVFDRKRDRLDANANKRLFGIARSRYDGLHLGPPPVREELIGNLLPVVSAPEFFYAAPARPRSHLQTRATLREAGAARYRAWAFSSGTIYTFHDPAETDLGILFAGGADQIATSEWADSDDQATLATYVQLLNGALEEQVYPAVKRGKNARLLFISAPKDLSSVSIPGRSSSNRMLVKVSRRDDGTVRYVRHLAFERRFRRYGDTWYLEIVPSYFFSSDGRRESSFAAKNLSGIKKKERHNDVKRHVETWDWILRDEVDLGEMTPDPNRRLLEFGQRAVVEIDSGADYEDDSSDNEDELAVAS